jgi:hypothetical protein
MGGMDTANVEAYPCNEVPFGHKKRDVLMYPYTPQSRKLQP